MLSIGQLELPKSNILAVANRVAVHAQQGILGLYKTCQLKLHDYFISLRMPLYIQRYLPTNILKLYVLLTLKRTIYIVLLNMVCGDYIRKSIRESTVAD